jgi:hypothetical protein
MDFVTLCTALPPPQRVTLPFICQASKSIISWELHATKKNLEELFDQLGGQQFHFLLSVTLQKLEEKCRPPGGFRVVDKG